MLKSKYLLVGTAALITIMTSVGINYLLLRDKLKVGTWVQVQIPIHWEGCDYPTKTGVIVKGPVYYKGLGIIYWVESGPPFGPAYIDWYKAKELFPMTRSESCECIMKAKFKLPGEE